MSILVIFFGVIVGRILIESLRELADLCGLQRGVQIEWRCWCVGFDFTFFPGWGGFNLGPLQFWWRSARYTINPLNVTEGVRGL